MSSYMCSALPPSSKSFLGPGVNPFMPASPRALYSAGAQHCLSVEGHSQTQAEIFKIGSAALRASSPAELRL